MKDKYKVPGLAVALVVLLVFVLFSGASAGNSEPLFEVRTDEFGEKVIEVTSPDLPRAQEVIEEYGAAAIEVNTRHPLGEIVEVTSQGEIVEVMSQEEIVLPTESEHFDAYEAEFGFIDDPEWLVRGFVTSFVGGFALSNGLMEYLQYYSFDEDGVPTLGVTSKDFVEEFRELDFTIRFEIIDPDEVRKLEGAAREIQERPYVAGACYSHLRGRIVVDLTSPSYDRYMDISREYPHLPFHFYFLDDPQPESLSVTDHVADDAEFLSVTTHGGGEKLNIGTSGFLADFYEWTVMVTHGHGTEFENVYSYDYGADVGATTAMINGGYGNDAGFYLIYPEVTFDNVINYWLIDGNGNKIERTIDIGGWMNSVTEGQAMFYASGSRGLVHLTVEDVQPTYLKYSRDKGGSGDSGSPLFWAWGAWGYYMWVVSGVHTHSAWWNPGLGYGTRIGQVQDLLNVSYPG